MNSRRDPQSIDSRDNRNSATNPSSGDSASSPNALPSTRNEPTFVGGKKGTGIHVGTQNKADSAPIASQSSSAEKSIESSLDQIQYALNSSRTYREFPSGSERYKELEEIARGGCGVVVRAYDRQLEREVVIKRILPGSTDSRETQNRFLNEARITGQLSHPGIVPVYEIGRNDVDGTPFYAMKWLQGSTLSVAIAELRKLHAGPTKVRKTRELLDRFLQICQTLAYAHTMRVVHRDLKPANIFIGQFGETVVVDWGLAKQIAPTFNANDAAIQTLGDTEALTNNNVSDSSNTSNSANSVRTSEDSSQTIARPNSQRIKPRRSAHGLARSNSQLSYSNNDSDIATMQGTVMGTASYMSPEQARGDAAAIGYPSDVFSLGTILYEILTGRSPFRANTVNDTLANVAIARYQPIRRIDRNVPRALAAICQKAMQLSPADRYQNAGELADDIQSFLADMPVEAFPEPLWIRLDRLAGKYKTAVRSIFGAIITIAMIAILASVSILNSLHKERIAKAEAQQRTIEREIALSRESEAHRESLVQLQSARKAVDAWLIDLSGNLQFYPGLSPIRTQLLDSAANYYGKLSQQSVETPFHRIESARAQIRLGDVHRLQNHHANSEQHYREALRILGELSIPTDPSLSTALSIQKANASMGLVLCAIENAEYSPDIERLALEAIAYAQKGMIIDRLEYQPHELDLREPKSRESINATIRANHVFARWLSVSGNITKAISTLEDHVAPAETLARTGGGSSEFHLLSTLLNDLGAFQYRDNQLRQSIATYEKLANLYTDFIDTANPRPDWLEGRADAKMKLGNCEIKRNNASRAATYYASANEDFNAAWTILYGEEFFRENLAISDANLGFAQLENGSPKLAESSLRSAIEMLQWLVSQQGFDTDRAQRIAQCYLWLAESLDDESSEETDKLISDASTIITYLEKQLGVTTATAKLRIQFQRIRAKRALYSNQTELFNELCNQSLSELQQSDFEILGNDYRALQKAEFELLRWQSLFTSADSATSRSDQMHPAFLSGTLDDLIRLSSSSNDSISASAFRTYLRAMSRYRTSESELQASLQFGEKATSRFPESADLWHWYAILAWECGERSLAIQSHANAKRNRQALSIEDELLENILRSTPTNESIPERHQHLERLKSESQRWTDRRFLEHLAPEKLISIETEMKS